MRSWKPLGLVPLQHDPKQLVAPHDESGSGGDGRQVSLSLPYATFAAPRAEPSHPALLSRGGSIASTALHFGIVALLIPVGRTVESSFFEQHMVYLLPLVRPGPVEIESPAGTGTSWVPTGSGAKTSGAPVPGALVNKPTAAVNKPTAAVNKPTSGPPAQSTTPGLAASDFAIVPTLQVSRTQLLRTETSRPFRAEAAVTEIAAGNAVVRDPASAAPEFPARLLATGVSGEVTARFIVDTLGIADVASYAVVRSTRAEFSDAVLRALPRMRFRPANQRGRLVRQWVEQTFHFRVQRNETALTKNEVDTPVERDLGSADPEFPKQLLAANIAGQVTARFVVDTMGVVDMTSYSVVQYSRPEFEEAVRGALPGMRFTPATQGGRLVRQWVEQTFHFRVQRKPDQ